jgi:hypothetical protein
MSSSWGAPKRDNNSNNNNNNSNDSIIDNVQGGPVAGHRASADLDRPAPNEHTRLLPNRVESTAWLSPDDPAVSPYNLWSVRIVRYLTILITFITFVWWVLQLVAGFVTIPGFHTRASGFFALSYASLTLVNLLITLIFFAVPAKAVRILSIVMGVLLLFDAIFIVAVQRTRYEEGWIGIATVLWAFAVSLWVLLTDRLVLWGKHEEEERLTGRAETRRTLGEWTAVLVSTVAMVVLALVLVMMSCTLILRGLDAGLAPPGKLYGVDGNKYQLHVFCQGNKTDAKGVERPTVLIEAGEGPVEDGLWSVVHDAIKNGSINRYCFVDRPGFAWVSRVASLP